MTTETRGPFRSARHGKRLFGTGQSARLRLGEPTFESGVWWASMCGTGRSGTEDREESDGECTCAMNGRPFCWRARPPLLPARRRARWRRRRHTGSAALSPAARLVNGISIYYEVQGDPTECRSSAKRRRLTSK